MGLLLLWLLSGFLSWFIVRAGAVILESIDSYDLDSAKTWYCEVGFAGAATMIPCLIGGFFSLLLSIGFLIVASSVMIALILIEKGTLFNICFWKKRDE